MPEQQAIHAFKQERPQMKPTSGFFSWFKRNILFDSSFWSAIVLILYFCLMALEHIFLAHTGLLLFSVITIITNKAGIRYTAGKITAIGLIFTIIFFVSKIIGAHHYNIKYGIHAEYLNHSLTVWALVISLTVCVAFPVFSLGFTSSVKALIDKKLFQAFAKAIQACSFIIVWILLSHAYEEAKSFDTWPLAADSYLNSDCTAPPDTYTIRKNRQSCYRIQWNGIRNPALQEFASPKP